jgi:hypothetical protein
VAHRGIGRYATTVLADQLQLLLSSLAADGVPYDIVAVDSLTDIALPKTSGGALRITDRDVLLVRADLRPPSFHLSDVHANTFDAVYSLGGLQVPSGWISAIVHTGNRHFRLVSTHLQGPVPGDPTAIAVQTAQANQFIHELRNSTVPVVIAGDFNSDAIQGTAGPGPDNTATAALIRPPATRTPGRLQAAVSDRLGPCTWKTSFRRPSSRTHSPSNAST